MFDGSARSPGCKALLQDVVELRCLGAIAQQGQQHFSLMVVGKKEKMVVASVQHEIIMFGAASAGQHLVSEFHAFPQNDPLHSVCIVLPGEALLTQNAPHQSLYPHLGLVAPFHQSCAAVVSDIDAAGGKEHTSEARTADLRGIHPHLLDFTGTVK